MNDEIQKVKPALLELSLIEILGWIPTVEAHDKISGLIAHIDKVRHEQLVEIIENERLNDDTGDTSDAAWESALDSVVEAINKVMVSE